MAYDAFVLLSFGGPEHPDHVMPFLRNVTRGRGVPEERLAEVAERARPVALAREHVLPLSPAFATLLPEGLRRGTTVAVGGATSLALALVAGPVAAGSWVAVVGMSSLGLAAADKEGLVRDATVVIHSAWAVNFTLRLASFVPHLAATRHLIDLAGAAGARFYFVSSTAAVAHATTTPARMSFRSASQSAN